MDSITNLKGVTFKIGQRVHWYGIPCTVRAIHSNHVYVDFTPENLARVPASDRWPLSPEVAARFDRKEFCRPRDHGATMGCFDEAHTD